MSAVTVDRPLALDRVRRPLLALAVGSLVALGRVSIAHALGTGAGDVAEHLLLVALAVHVLLLAAERAGALALALPSIALAVVGDLVGFRVLGVGGGAVAGLGAAFPLAVLAAALAVGYELKSRAVAPWTVPGALGLILLVLPLFPGLGRIKGHQSGWIHLPGIGDCMPGELGRPLVILAFAMIVVAAAGRSASVERRLADLSGAIRPGGWLLGTAVLIQLFSRDLGPVVLLVTAAMVTVALVTGNLRLVVSGIAVVLLAIILVGLVVPYVGARVDNVVDPFAPQTGGVVGQAAFSRMALAWGGIVGTGLGQGLVTGISGLPAAGTDLALITFALETGLVGLIAVLGLLSSLLWVLWRRVGQAESAAAQVIAGSLVGLLTVQTAWVAGAVTGFLPLSGLTLPFVSAGGSSAAAVSIVVATAWVLAAPSPTAVAGVSARPLPAVERMAAATVLALGVLAGATGLRVDHERDALNSNPANPLWIAKNRDRGVVLGAGGMVLQRTVHALSLNTMQRVTAASEAVRAVLGNAADAMPDQGIGLTGTMRAALRCGGSGQFRLLGPGWEGGAPIVVGNRAACRPAGLQTTLDPQLTGAADAALGGRPGSVTVMDARSGAVLALAGRAIGRAGPHPEMALRASLPPGSSMKVVVSALAAANGFSSWPWGVTHVSADGVVVGGEACGGDLTQILGESCNQAFAGLAEQAGAQALAGQARRLGFDQDADIDGVAVARSTVFGASKPSPGLTATAGIGQGHVLSTGVGMAQVAATIAADGVWHRPRLVDAICSADGRSVLETAPDVHHRAMSPAVAGRVAGAMRGPLSAYGTARSIASLPWITGAKTGTAEVEARADLRSPPGSVAWLVATTRASAHHGPLAIAVNVLPTRAAAHPYGGRDAAGVVARMNTAIERYLSGPAATRCDANTTVAKTGSTNH